MKILHLVSSGGYYGKEAVIVNLCSALEKLGYSTEVGAFLNYHAPNDEVVIRARQQHLRASTFACRGSVDLRTVRTIRDHILAQQIDLIHTHDYKSDLYGYLAARWAGRPVFATSHLWFGTTIALRIYSVLDRLVLRYFDGIIAVSPAIARTLRRSWIPKRKLAVIANGIDLSPFLSVEDRSPAGASGEFRIGIVGRLTRQKGHPVFFHAARGVLRKFPAARFVVVGEGPDRQELQHLAQELGIAAQVTFSGYCQDMPGAYASLDLMVMPSLDEGMPMTLLEAMAAKRAVIASSVGAIPEIVKHGETGLLVQPGSADDLLQAMVTLLENSSLRQRMAESARQSVARFSAESMARGYIDFYQRIGCRSITAATSPRFSTQA